MFIRYKAYAYTEIVDDSGNVVQRDVETTFAHKLKDLNWLPARVANTCSDLAGRANKAQETVLKVCWGDRGGEGLGYVGGALPTLYFLLFFYVLLQFPFYVLSQ